MFAIFGEKFVNEEVPYAKVQKATCPHCKKEAPLIRVRGRRYFQMFFISLFPTSDTKECFKCGYCNAVYEVPKDWDFDLERANGKQVEKLIENFLK